MNSYQQLIQQIKSANYSNANQTFAEIMQQKVADRLAAEQRTIFKEDTAPELTAANVDAKTKEAELGEDETAPELTAANVDAKTKEAALGEDEMSAAEKAERERLVKGMKKGDWSRYGSRAKEVMYATATKKAMGS